jgi:hypothetical protein
LFQLTPDFRLLPSPGALSLTRRSRGQLTRTYLTLFLAMFVTARARMPFRPTVRRLPIFLRGPTTTNYLFCQTIFRTLLRSMLRLLAAHLRVLLPPVVCLPCGTEMTIAVRRLPILIRGPAASNYLSHQRIFQTPLRPMLPKETALRLNMNPVRAGTWSTMAESVLESEGIEREIVLDMFEVWDLLSILRSF